MSVRAAARVMSSTVAAAIETLGYENTEETVRFIRKVNEFFDCLNGAHHLEASNENNPVLQRTPTRMTRGSMSWRIF